MTLHAFNLLVKHRLLDEKLRAEQARPLSDPARITKLKKLKLIVKDHLHRLSQGRQTQAA